MKTKLLRKVRRKFRIIENDNGIQFLQEKDLFGWDEVNMYHLAMVEKLYEYSDMIGKFRALLDFRHSKYKRINKIEKQKEKQIKILRYNANS